MLSAEIKVVLRRARQRYRRLRVEERPPLEQPHNACGLFKCEDMLALAKSRLWPLPLRIQRWLAAGSMPTEDERFRQTLLRYAHERRQELRRLLSAILWPGKAARHGKA